LPVGAPDVVLREGLDVHDFHGVDQADGQVAGLAVFHGVLRSRVDNPVAGFLRAPNNELADCRGAVTPERIGRCAVINPENIGEKF